MPELRQELAQKLITENRNSKEGGSDVALDLAREATNVSKQREEFVGCSLGANDRTRAAMIGLKRGIIEI